MIFKLVVLDLLDTRKKIEFLVIIIRHKKED